MTATGPASNSAALDAVTHDALVTREWMDLLAAEDDWVQREFDELVEAGLGWLPSAVPSHQSGSAWSPLSLARRPDVRRPLDDPGCAWAMASAAISRGPDHPSDPSCGRHLGPCAGGSRSTRRRGSGVDDPEMSAVALALARGPVPARLGQRQRAHHESREDQHRQEPHVRSVPPCSRRSPNPFGTYSQMPSINASTEDSVVS
jgi:hypothetical protein